MRVYGQLCRRSVDRGTCGPGIEPRKEKLLRGAHGVVCSEGNMESFVIARAFPPPRGPRPCARTEVIYTGAGRSRLWPWRWSKGPRCESGRNTTAMHGSGKSDRLIVAVKRLNKDNGAPSSAENVEPSSLTKGNSFQSTKYRTQRRGGT